MRRAVLLSIALTATAWFAPSLFADDTAPAPSPGADLDAGVPDAAVSEPPASAAPELPLPPAPATEPSEPDESLLSPRHFAGSVQLDYLATSERDARPVQELKGGTIEMSLKLTVDINKRVSSSIKVCFACHGFETGMAFFDMRVRDELNVRVGRFTPAFGNFPLRHDPANHGTSDKPLPYDMGRMAHLSDWNEGILPAPWVDNGIELDGSHFFGDVQVDYAAYAIGGPKGDAEGFDFDFKQSRSPERYYVDNNSQPTVGARVSVTADLTDRTIVTVGSSAMGGRYDPAARLGFGILGVDATLQLDKLFLRAEYLARWTQIALGDDPSARFKFGPGTDGTYADFTLKDGFVFEAEQRLGSIDLIARVDGLRRWGNVPAMSELPEYSRVLRYTAALAYRIAGTVRLKSSLELYDFSDYKTEVASHVGLVGGF